PSPPHSHLHPCPTRRSSDLTSFDSGLGLFALSGLGLPTVFRHVRQALSDRARHRGRRLIAYDDLPELCIESQEPVNFQVDGDPVDRKSTRLNSSHQIISYAV